MEEARARLLDAQRREAAATDVFGILGYLPEAAQQQLHDATEFDVGYGGRAGGGKTKALLMEGIRACVRYPGMRVGAFRRTYDELEESFLAELAKIDFAEVFGATYAQTNHLLKFPTGSVIRFRYVESMLDATRRQGGEYQLVLIDERQQLLPDVAGYLVTRIRSSDPQIPVIGVRSSFNPGDIGHSFLKDRYIDKTGHGQDVYEDVVGGKPTGKMVKFIPAPRSKHVGDGYEGTLAMTADPELRRALADGDWDVFPGQLFTEWRYETHVIEPEDFPMSLGGVRRGIGIDWGLRNPFAAVWGYVTADGTIIIYRELYETNLTPTEQAQLILASEMPGERERGRPMPAWIDPSTFNRQPDSPKPVGREAPKGSVAKLFDLAGVPVHRGNHDHRLGIAEIHQRLRLDPLTGRPRMLVYSTCRELIRTLPVLPRSRINPEDVDRNAEDHLFDALRYLLLGMFGKASKGEPDVHRGRGTTEAVTGGLAKREF